MQPIPHRCIWCKCDTSATATDVSHVLPQCLGNASQQTLPPGVVCKSCNSHFGHKVEPVLLRDPILHAIAVFLQIVDPSDKRLFREKMFDAQHPPVGRVEQNLDMNLHLQGSRLELKVGTTVRGTIAHEYSHRELKLLSRAIHKIAFESVAWQLYVSEAEAPKRECVFDPFSGMFDSVRVWSRLGYPMTRVRPVVRKPATSISGDWHVRLWSFPEGVGCEVNLFADWYAVSLTSTPELAEQHLRQWTAATPGPKWLLADSLLPFGVQRSTGTERL
jgi:HNH endonuclease